MNTDPNKTYTAPTSGREYKVTAIGKIPDTEKWIGQVLKNKWYTYIRFLDNGEYAKVLHDYNDKPYKIEKL